MVAELAKQIVHVVVIGTVISDQQFLDLTQSVLVTGVVGCLDGGQVAVYSPDGMFLIMIFLSYLYLL